MTYLQKYAAFLICQKKHLILQPFIVCVIKKICINYQRNIQKSNADIEMLEYLEENNIHVKFLYSIDNPNDDYGYYDPIDNVIRIFVDKIVTIGKTAEIIIHEAAHRKYDIGNDPWSEAVCIAQEVKNRMRRNTLTSQEKRNIIKLSKESYSKFPWRRV